METLQAPVPCLYEDTAIHLYGETTAFPSPFNLPDFTREMQLFVTWLEVERMLETCILCYGSVTGRLFMCLFSVIMESNLHVVFISVTESQIIPFTLKSVFCEVYSEELQLFLSLKRKRHLIAVTHFRCFCHLLAFQDILFTSSQHLHLKKLPDD